MATVTIRIKLNADNRITDCVRMRCCCGLTQYISDKDAAIPGVFECQCGEPFALVDVLGNVYPIGRIIRKGVGNPYGR